MGVIKLATTCRCFISASPMCVHPWHHFTLVCSQYIDSHINSLDQYLLFTPLDALIERFLRESVHLQNLLQNHQNSHRRWAPGPQSIPISSLPTSSSKSSSSYTPVTIHTRPTRLARWFTSSLLPAVQLVTRSRTHTIHQCMS